MATTAVPSQGHPPTSTGLDNRKIAIWAFIGSECMLFLHTQNMKAFGVPSIITFAILMTLTLYWWLLTPLEDAH